MVVLTESFKRKEDHDQRILACTHRDFLNSRDRLRDIYQSCLDKNVHTLLLSIRSFYMRPVGRNGFILGVPGMQTCVKNVGNLRPGKPC